MGVAAEDAGWSRLGGAIRERRLRRSLSLVDLASRADLSQPFLSQVENGRARPSLLSLRRIAQALETTPQALFEGPFDALTRPTVVRAGDVQTVEIAEPGAEGRCRLLLTGEAPVHLLEFDGLPERFLDYFEHDGFEVIHVVAGTIEVDLDGAVTQLETGDSMAYASHAPHRFRSTGVMRAHVLLVEAARVSRDGDHVVTRTARTRRTTSRDERPPPESAARATS